MLGRVDAHEGDVAKVTSADYRRIVDLCWQCKLCFNHCPYTPPHRFDIDFPRLMLRSKAARAAAEGVSWQDRWLGSTDALGTLASAAAPLANWANSSAAGRALLEKTFGIERHRALPKFHHKTFNRWFRERGGGRVAEGHKVAFFTTCVVNYNEPQVGRDAVSVLEKNGCAVSCPESQLCCGMPYLDGGDLDAARANARRNLDALKKEYPLLVPGEAAEAVAAKTFDTFEFLVGRHREGRFATDFEGRSPGKVAYQAPCHLRAQNMGYKTRDVLQLIPGTKVTVVERCTAMDGTWGMKKEFYPISLQFARQAAREMEAAQPDTYATDCSLAALQLEDVRGARPAHPVSLLREAYGLAEER